MRPTWLRSPSSEGAPPPPPRVPPLPPDAQALAAALRGVPAPVYAVGGTVRDALLRGAAHDLDVAGPLLPEALAAALAGRPDIQVAGRDVALGTVLLRLSGGVEAEYTAFRRESYRGGRGRHRPVAVRLGATLEEDALRRDFTVNALYWDLRSGAILDPTGGLPDLARRVLRTPRPPRQTLGEDGLRLLRLVRFAAELDFDVEAETLAAARALCALIDDIAPERIWAELTRLLMADARSGLPPARTVLRGLELLQDTGLLRRVLPEVWAGRGIRQRPRYHDFDVMEHAFHACAQADPTLLDRTAALLHDIGKPAAQARDGSMHGHDSLGAAMVQDIARRLRWDKALAREVEALVAAHMYDLTGQTHEDKLRWFLAQMGRDRAGHWVALRRADFRGSKRDPDAALSTARWEGLYAAMLADGTPFSPREVALDGRDIATILGEPPSPRIGAMQRALWKSAVQHPSANRPDILRRRVLQLKRDPRQWLGNQGGGQP